MDRDVEESILLKCYQFGQPLPKHILEAPELAPGLEYYFNAYKRLSTCRQVGMGIGPIPWTAIHEYARMQELCQSDEQDLEYLVGRMDSAFLEWNSRKNGGDKD